MCLPVKFGETFHMAIPSQASDIRWMDEEGVET